MNAHRSLLISALLLTSLPALACPGLSVDDAHIVQGPPGASTLAGFVTFKNAGDKPLVITGASDADFATAEFHQTMMMGSMMHMMHEDSLTIPAKGSLTLAPGGYHLMLNSPKKELKAGDTSTVTLKCGAQSLDVVFAVKAP